MEKKSREENRIYLKIQSKKFFQSESWEQIDYILNKLVEEGYSIPEEISLEEIRQKGGKFQMEKNESERAVVVVNEYLGKYIQVVFD